jgi:hypothetical protein
MCPVTVSLTIFIIVLKSFYLYNYLSQMSMFAETMRYCYTIRRRGIRDNYRPGSTFSTADAEQDVLLMQHRLCEFATEYTRLPGMHGHARCASHG